MYHILITDKKKDKVILDTDTNTYTVVANGVHEDDDEGTYAASGATEASNEEILQLLLGMDMLKERLIKNHPITGLMYALKDEIVDKTITHDLLTGEVTTD